MSEQRLVDSSADEDVLDELQPGTTLLHGQYTITRFLNSGGFGITYLAKDSLDRTVVIKECFPGAFCRRSNTVVSARSRAHQSELKSIIRLFVQEARGLSKLVHPNIVGVHQVFEDNATAYMAIDYVDGQDLLDIIEDEKICLSPPQVVRMTEKLLSAVRFIHDNGVLHRDISPDNVLLNSDGEPILIDFGAAREQASKGSRVLSALRVVKDGYSPQEFYIAGSEQGPWSDLYALAATLYHVIRGQAPVNGQVRLAALAEGRDDPYQPLSGRVNGYPAGFLEAIDKAMRTLPHERVQTAAEWLGMFSDAAAEPAEVDGDPVAAISELIMQEEQFAAEEEEEARREQEAPAEAEEQAEEETAPEFPAPEADLEECDDEEEEQSDLPDEFDFLAPPETHEEAPRSKRGLKLMAGMVAVAVILGAGGLYGLLSGEEDSEIAQVAPDAPEAGMTAGAETGAPLPAVAEQEAAQRPVLTERSPEWLANMSDAGLIGPAPEGAVPAARSAQGADASSDPAATEEAPGQGQDRIEITAPEEGGEGMSDLASLSPAETSGTASASDTSPAPVSRAADLAQPELTAEAPSAPAVAVPAAEALSLPEPAAAGEGVRASAMPRVAMALPEAVAAETAVPRTVAEAEAQPTVLPAARQVTYAHWDVDMPFTSSLRSFRNADVALVTRISPGADLDRSGNWIEEGTAIYTVNGEPVDRLGSVAAMVLNALSVDPDGYTRASVRYKEAGSGRFMRGLLAVPAFRQIGLANGVVAEAAVEDGQWRTQVVSAAEATGLRPGDIILHEGLTATEFDAANALEKTLAALVSRESLSADLSILRDGGAAAVRMPLVVKE